MSARVEPPPRPPPRKLPLPMPTCLDGDHDVAAPARVESEVNPSAPTAPVRG